MNDPHVEALFYRINHAENVHYTRAKPLTHQCRNFSIQLKDGIAEITMFEHHATEESARKVVDPFLQAWEMQAGLQHHIGVMEFAFERAQIVDRNPPSGHVLLAGAAQFHLQGMPAKLVIGRSAYPAPPVDISRDATVDLMFNRYRRYVEGRTTLADAANYCLTALELCGGRKQASVKFAISQTVLNMIGELAATKGGIDARKAEATSTEFSPNEKCWLEEAIKKIILRVAEVAHDSNVNRPQITMADLPPV